MEPAHLAFGLGLSPCAQRGEGQMGLFSRDLLLGEGWELVTFFMRDHDTPKYKQGSF